MTTVAVIIPALNEAAAIESVIRNIPPVIDQIIVADNGSTDDTATIARKAGAHVVSEPCPGYGRACMAGVAAATDAEILVFLDGDGADAPDQMNRILRKMTEGPYDLVIGSRALGTADKGALTLPQRFGNKLAVTLINWIWGMRYTDLGPFRAIRRDAYDKLRMAAPTYGWTVEMQVRALKADLRVAEVPVDYRRRIGKSKISGTVKGVILAGAFILGTIFHEAIRRRR